MNTVTSSQGNMSGRPTPPVVSVSSFHSRESSVDSQMSLGSHHSSLGGSGVARRSQDCAVGGRLGTKDLLRSSSQEVGIAGAHYDFKSKIFKRVCSDWATPLIWPLLGYLTLVLMTWWSNWIRIKLIWNKCWFVLGTQFNWICTLWDKDSILFLLCER